MFSDINSRIALSSFGAVFIVVATAPTAAFAQAYVGTSSLHGKTVVMPRGTTWEGRLNITIGSRSKPGQPFMISMSAPVLANGTDVLIPAGSQILGEVVEAIPAGEVPHPKGMKPTGKLRVQLSTLRTPDGITYPLVASLTGEQPGRNSQAVKGLGGGIGYVGTTSGFEAVAPGAANRSGNRGGRPLTVMSKRDIMSDPIYGVDPQDQQNGGQAPKIRSLVLKGRDLYIAAGSPVTVKLDAPFKIGISQAAGAEATITPQVDLNPDGTFGRRFLKQAAPVAPQQDPSNPGGPAIAPGENPLPGILPDTPHAYVPVTLPPGAAPQAPANIPPPAAQAAPAQALQGQPAALPQSGQAATPAKGDF